jgi:hypothetical protein
MPLAGGVLAWELLPILCRQFYFQPYSHKQGFARVKRERAALATWPLPPSSRAVTLRKQRTVHLPTSIWRDANGRVRSSTTPGAKSAC